MRAIASSVLTGDVGPAGLRESLKSSVRQLRVRVCGRHLGKRAGARDDKEWRDDESWDSHQKLVAERSGRRKSRAQLAELDC